jgi:membrane protein implicated in regulation of membrane protease activity
MAELNRVSTANNKVLIQKQGSKRFDDPIYTQLIINKSLTGGLYVVMSIVFILCTSVVFGHIVQGSPWEMAAFSVCLFCLAVVAYPQTEGWRYQHWQKAHRQVERHFCN